MKSEAKKKNPHKLRTAPCCLSKRDAQNKKKIREEGKAGWMAAYELSTAMFILGSHLRHVQCTGEV